MALTSKWVVGADSNKGRRPENQDFVAVDEALGLYVVADGTGGRAGGETAARLACETIHRQVKAAFQSTTAVLDDARVRDILAQAATDANNRILAGQQEKAELHGMATTVVLALCRDATVYVGHIGDSRAYLLQRGKLRQLTRDHSLENYLVDNPQVKPKVKRPGATLVRALGMGPKPPVLDVQSLSLAEDDLLLLCTDGITEALSEMILSEILKAVPATSPIEAAQCMTRAALRHGSMDNITAAVLRPTSSAHSGTVLFSPPSDELATGQLLGWVTFFEGPYRGKVLSLGPSTRLGAGPTNQIILTDSFVSTAHAEILPTDDGFVVRDAGSTNGTFVNNIRIAEQPLVDGDTVRVGRTSMVFKSYRTVSG